MIIGPLIIIAGFQLNNTALIIAGILTFCKAVFNTSVRIISGIDKIDKVS